MSRFSEMIPRTFPQSIPVWVGLFLVPILALTFSPPVPAASGQTGPSGSPWARNGVLDLTAWDPTRDGPVRLNGEWEFYWERLLTPENFQRNDPSLRPVPAQVPGTWNGLEIGGRSLAGQGFATYRLTVLLPAASHRLGLKFLDAATSLSIWAGGRHLAQMGTPAENSRETVPGFSPQVVELPVSEDRLEILAQVANYHHWLGGLWEPIKLGRLEDVAGERERNLALNLFLCGAILIIGFYHIVLFALRTSDRSPLYFGLFCLLMALRTLTTGETYLVTLFPELGWSSLNRLIYVGVYLGLPAMALFVDSLFPRESPGKIIRAIAMLSLALTALVMIAPSAIYTPTMPWFQGLIILWLFCGLYVVGRARVRRREGAGVFLAGFFLLVIAIINDILDTRLIIKTFQVAPLGLLCFIVAQAVLLSIRHAKTFTLIEAQTQELDRTNRAYVKEIDERKKAEAALRESESQYRLLAENVQDNIFTLDIDGLRFTYLSPSVKNMLGYEPEELTGVPLQRILEPESNEHVLQILAEELILEEEGADPNRSRKLEVLERHKDGRVIWIEATVSALRDEQGRIKGILGVSREVTRRREIEQELSIYQERLEELVRRRTAQLTKAYEQLHKEIAERTRAEEGLKLARDVAGKANQARG